ncbi:MAG TPA: hypothetical protein VHC69_13050 [Polyangiaceae bacterium]|nr:hypothetical protein [Polyangiaceae bacterium]
MLSLRAFAAAVALATVLAAAPARAGIAACGNIDVTADAKCTANVDPGGCEAQCTPPSFEAACAAKLEAQCETMCNKLPDVSCTGSCQGDCETECNAQPATFDCEGNCTANCNGDCQSKCSSSSNSTDCEAQCNATCSSECHGQCTATPAEVDCKGKCEASCQGSCKVDANFDCQTTCQGQGFVDCKTNVQPGICKAQCQEPHGAIFCNGQFVDNGGNAEQCIDALKAYLSSHVVVNAAGSAMCTSDDVCEAQGKVSCHCSTPARRGGSTSGLLAIAGLLGLAGALRLRRR